MSVEARDQLAELLEQAGLAVPPCVQVNAAAEDLRLEVDGVGRIRFPVSPAQARRLVGRAVPARFGRGEQTLTDLEVRDTWEVPRDLVHVEWVRGTDGILAPLRQGLGIPPSRRLTAELHSLLVYSPGQFFQAHQDSEKNDDMVASLVVTLPSRHTGGELVIHHGSESRVHRGWPSDLALVAFHADRRHEVRPVTSGFRIALTFNLLLGVDSADDAADDGKLTGELAACLTRHFSTGRRRPYRDEPDDPPKRLVYLLDHEYTERGLSWSRLKGPDAGRVAQLRQAAQLAGCESVLGLAEVKETWDANERSGHTGRYGYDDDDDDFDDDGHGAGSTDIDDDYDVQELIDSAVTLGRWLEPDGTHRIVHQYIPAGEVAASTPSAELRPYSSNYEGYMGNYGNTLDRWYRRAALVIWPRTLSFQVRAEAAPSWALEELLARVDGADLGGARVAAEAFLLAWDGVVVPEEAESLLTLALRAADGLDDPALGGRILARFRVEDLGSPHLPPLVAATRRYGVAWLAGVLNGWLEPVATYLLLEADRVSWLSALPDLCGVAVELGDGGALVVERLLASSWAALREGIQEACALSGPSVRAQQLADLGPALAGLLAAASDQTMTEVSDSVSAFCREQGDEIVDVLRSALASAGPPGTARRRDNSLAALAADFVRRLQARVFGPVRADDDWSLRPPGDCGCELCRTLAGFLTDPTSKVRDWPLAEKGRRHIHARIDLAELPVIHRTRRTGRPFTLVLTKDEALFERERRERERDRAELDLLLAAWPGVGD